MPRYYCDYCDTYLTHDSPSVRKQHNAGYKHKANVRSYYQQFEEQQTQSLIDQKVKEHLGQAGYPQVGAAFHQHLMAQGGQYRPPISLPVLQPPTLAVPGAIRPPVLPRPPVPAPGYGAPGVVRPPGMDMNGVSQSLPHSTALTPPGAPGVRPPISYPSMSPNTSMPSGTTGTPLSNGLYANFAPSSGSYAPQGPGAPTNDTQYSSQQAFRPMGPTGSSRSSGLDYSQGPISTHQSISSNYSSSTPNYGM